MASPVRPIAQPLTVPLTLGAFDCIQSTLVSDGGGGGGDGGFVGASAVMDFENSVFSVGGSASTLTGMLPGVDPDDVTSENGWAPSGSSSSNFTSLLSVVVADPAGLVGVLDVEHSASEDPFQQAIVTFFNSDSSVGTLAKVYNAPVGSCLVAATDFSTVLANGAATSGRFKFAFRIVPDQWAIATTTLAEVDAEPDISKFGVWDAVNCTLSNDGGWKVYSLAFYPNDSDLATLVGGGGGDYVAPAVHFDGTASDVGSQVFISTTFPTLPAFTDFSFAGWVKAADISTFLFLFNQNFDNDGSIVPGLSISTGFNFSSDVLLYVRDPTGAGTERVLAGSNDEVYTTGVWHFVCASGQINLAQNSKVLQLLMDSVNIINPENDVDLGDAFSVELTGTVLTIPGWNGGEGVACDLADFQFWFDQAIDFSNPTNLGKFVSGGKPVDPAVAALAFGQQSILLSGDATSTGFQKNQGSFGDIFTLTGAVIDATTSPSD